MFNSSPIPGWRQYSKRYNLEGSRCCICDKAYYDNCFLCSCGSRAFKPFKFSGLGKLISYTNITNPCVEFKHMPVYCIGLIELVEGPRMMAQIADVSVSDLSIGLMMQATFRKFYSHGSNGIIEYGLKFVPLLK